MSIPFHDNIDGQGLEYFNFKHQALSADPVAGVGAGFTYFNTVDGRLRVHDGSSFKAIGFGTTLTPVALTIGGAAAVGTAIDYAHADHVHAMPGLVTTTVSGFMSFGDKVKLDAATPSVANSTLVMRDAAGRAQVADPTATQDIATKGYVDTVVQGLGNKYEARVASTANVSLTTPGAAIDGITLAVGDRVLLKNQTAPAENGIYIWSGAAVALARSLDFNAWSEIPAAFVFIQRGTTNADTGWLCTSDDGGTLGTTAINWTQFSGAGSYSATNDPTITGIGVYASTSGSQFRFRAIKAGSTKVGVTLSGTDILVDVNEGNLNLANLGGTLPVSKGGTGGTTPITARQGIGAVGKFEADIGNGALQTFTVNHNLGTVGLSGVAVWENTGQRRKVEPRIQIVDINNIQITFATAAPAANAYHVVVTG